jgi:Ssp1 endopeptidase immunity protein Rap1a
MSGRIHVSVCIATMIALGAVAAAEEDIRSGNYWFRKCAGADYIACHGLLLGLLDYNSLMDGMHQKRAFCPPDGVTIEQAREIVVKAQREKPEMLHLPFTLFAIAAPYAGLPLPLTPNTNTNTLGACQRKKSLR